MRYALLLLLAIGCYDAPDYGGTRFKCDADHGCPDGQMCIGGYCSGSGSGSPDAKTPDAPPAGAGVLCGTVTCAITQKCCADVLNGPSCIGLTASCNGFAAVCDGTEDCAGQPCCENGQNFICGTTCSNQICREAADCLNPAAPMCCFNTGTMEPWGRCLNACI